MARSCNPFPGRPQAGWRSEGAEHVAKSAGRANSKASAKIIRIITHLGGKMQYATRHARLDDIIFVDEDSKDAHDRGRRKACRFSYCGYRCRACTDRIEDCEPFVKDRGRAHAMPVQDRKSTRLHYSN